MKTSKLIKTGDLEALEPDHSRLQRVDETTEEAPVGLPPPPPQVYQAQMEEHLISDVAKQRGERVALGPKPT